MSPALSPEDAAKRRCTSPYCGPCGRPSSLYTWRVYGVNQILCAPALRLRKPEEGTQCRDNGHDGPPPTAFRRHPRNVASNVFGHNLPQRLALAGDPVEKLAQATLHPHYGCRCKTAFLFLEIHEGLQLGGEACLDGCSCNRPNNRIQLVAWKTNHLSAQCLFFSQRRKDVDHCFAAASICAGVTVA